MRPGQSRTIPRQLLVRAVNREPLRALVSRIEAAAEQINTSCAEGTMPFRRWRGGEAAAPIVLVHGGSGSWTHWIRNIERLAERAEIIAPDLPGLGDAASLPEGYTAEDAARWLRKGLDEVSGREYHLVAFSWGCVPTTLAAVDNPRVRSLMLIGSAAMGGMPERPVMQPLIRRTPEMSEDEVDGANRENLARLMIHDRAAIDDLAVYLQTENTRRSRFNSPPFARTTLVLDSLQAVDAPISFLYGSEDATAKPNLDYRRDLIHSSAPDVGFEVYEGVGHWLQYEAAERFNAGLLRWLEID